MNRSVDLIASVAFVVLMLGGAAWVFPRSAEAFSAWTLPIFSAVALGLTLALVRDWPWLRGFVLALVVAILIGGAPMRTNTAVAHFAGASLGVLAMVWVGRVVTTSQRLRWMTVIYLGGGLAVLLLGLTGSYFEELSPFMRRLTQGLPDLRLGLVGLGPFGYVNPNALAAAVLLVMPLGLAVVTLKTGNRVDFLTLLPLGVLVVLVGGFVLIVTQSKSAFLAVWLTTAAVVVRGPRSATWRVVTTLALVAPALLAVGAVQFVSRDVFVLKAGSLWSTVHDRAEVMAFAFEQLKQSPWVGIGLNDFRSLYHTPVPSDIAHAHNVFLQTALDIGVLGLVAYLSVLAFILVRADQLARGAASLTRTVAVGAALSLLAVSAFGFGDAVPLGTKIGMLQWLLCGAILAAWRVQREPARVS